jgi:hypothetical protein
LITYINLENMGNKERDVCHIALVVVACMCAEFAAGMSTIKPICYQAKCGLFLLAVRPG